MDANHWANQHIAPDGGNTTVGAAQPTEATLAKMRADEYLAAEYELYDYAKTLLDCKLRACGLQVHDASHASSFALEFADS